MSRESELQEIRDSMRIISEPGSPLVIKTYKMPKAMQERINEGFRRGQARRDAQANEARAELVAIGIVAAVCGIIFLLCAIL